MFKKLMRCRESRFITLYLVGTFMIISTLPLSHFSIINNLVEKVFLYVGIILMLGASVFGTLTINITPSTKKAFSGLLRPRVVFLILLSLLGATAVTVSILMFIYAPENAGVIYFITKVVFLGGVFVIARALHKLLPQKTITSISPRHALVEISISRAQLSELRELTDIKNDDSALINTCLSIARKIIKIVRKDNETIYATDQFETYRRDLLIESFLDEHRIKDVIKQKKQH